MEIYFVKKRNSETNKAEIIGVASSKEEAEQMLMHCYNDRKACTYYDVYRENDHTIAVMDKDSEETTYVYYVKGATGFFGL